MSDIASGLRAESGRLPEAAAGRRIQSVFEFWPRGVFYFPFIVQWLMLGLRHHSLCLPTLANPQIEAGGLCGESKTRLFATFGPECRRHLAPYASVQRAPDPQAIDRDLACAREAMRGAGLSFPLIVKPDIGCQGAGVQLVADAAQLRRYIEGFPCGERFLLQRWIGDPGEAGIFYIRDPDAADGFIFSITLKYFPFVTGDGRSTVEALIRADSRARRIARIYLARLGEQRHRVLASGEQFRLVLTGNHCKGAVFRDGTHLVTPALTGRLNRLARDIPEFHFGRFDVRFASLACLQSGRFTIIEVNGAGSEATHVWDPDIGLVEAYQTLFRQFAMLFKIAAKNRARGKRPMPVLDLLRLYRRQQRLMAAYPLSQ